MRLLEGKAAKFVVVLNLSIFTICQSEALMPRIDEHSVTVGRQINIYGTKDVTVVLSGAGMVLHSYSYTPNGENIMTDGLKDVMHSKYKNRAVFQDPFQYSGEYFDSESGLYYQRARYYNPEMQRFIQRDGSLLLNRYAYANQNPIMNVDPSGHRSHAVFTLLHILGAMAGIFGIFLSTDLLFSGGGTTALILEKLGIFPRTASTALLEGVYGQSEGVESVLSEEAVSSQSSIGGSTELSMRRDFIRGYKRAATNFVKKGNIFEVTEDFEVTLNDKALEEWAGVTGLDENGIVKIKPGFFESNGLREHLAAAMESSNDLEESGYNAFDDMLGKNWNSSLGSPLAGKSTDLTKDFADEFEINSEQTENDGHYGIVNRREVYTYHHNFYKLEKRWVSKKM